MITITQKNIDNLLKEIRAGLKRIKRGWSGIVFTKKGNVEINNGKIIRGSRDAVKCLYKEMMGNLPKNLKLNKYQKLIRDKN